MESKFLERYPKAALQFFSWPIQEAKEETPFKVEPKDAENFYFWGLGKGEVISKLDPWLKEDAKRRLIILEEDVGIIRSLLQKSPTLLDSEQIHLEWEFLEPEEMEALIKKFPAKKIDFAALPSKAESDALRLKIFRKASLEYALHIDRLHGYQPFLNFCQNLKMLPHSFYANKLVGQFKEVPAIVCGAGPTLDQSIERLRDLTDKALIIGGGSTLAALSSKGVMPHLGMALDPNLEEYRRFRNSFCFDVPLLYSTRVHPGVFNTTNGPFGYMRSGVGGLLELWIEEELGLQEELLGTFLPDETVSVTNMCLALAIELGCNPIYLCGVDLAYVGQKHYASGVTENKTLSMLNIDAKLSPPDRILERVNGKGEKVYTAVRWVMEAEAISKTVKNYPDRAFFNMSQEGLAIDQVPYKTPQGLKVQKDLSARINSVIEASQCKPETKKILDQCLKELKSSLDRLIEHLEVMTEKRKGVKALSEFELEEEIATLYLFYDIKHILTDKKTFWDKWLAIAYEYQRVLCTNFNVT